MAEVEHLEIVIEAESEEAIRNIERFSAAMAALKQTAQVGGSKKTAEYLSTLANMANSIQSGAPARLKEFAESIGALSTVQKPTAITKTLSTNISGLAQAAREIDGGVSSNIRDLVVSLNSLSEVQKASGLRSTINALEKIPDVSAKLKNVGLDDFARQMRQAADAVKPLANEMEKVSNGFAAFPIRIQKLIQTNESLNKSNNNVSKSYGVLGTRAGSSLLKFSAISTVLYKVTDKIGDWVTESNAYIENLNLFNVAMGDYADSARAYAEEVAGVMGIDPSAWMRNQGIFMTLTDGFGVAADRAAFMSKNLTQLGYDISSFYNISVEEAMQKLQSGISGELEPLRRLGFDLSQARLQAVALSEGIDQSVASMTQAEKAQLRYQAILTQVTQVQGDMARTLNLGHPTKMAA